MTFALLLTVFGLSLVGSLHCAAMCGGFVAAYVDSPTAAGVSRFGRTLAHLAYNLGRLTTYVVLGAAAGALGKALNLGGRLVGVGGIATVITGVLLIAMGILRLRGARSGLITLGRRRSRAFGLYPTKLLVAFASKPVQLRALVLGLTSTLLPCGWLYAFVVAAAGTGSAVGGASVMAAFWLGSVPIMTGLGLSLDLLSSRLRGRIPHVSAAILIGVGLATLVIRVDAASVAQRTQAPGSSAHPPGCPFHSASKPMPGSTLP